MQNSTTSNKPDAAPSPPNPPPDLSESDFLAAEAAAARQKIVDNVQRLRDDLKGCADVAAWARKYPWPTLGIAAGLGFLAATALGARRAKDNPAQVLAEALAAQRTSAADHPKPSIFASLFGELLRGLIGALEPIVANAFRSPAPTGTPTTNGQPPPADIPADPTEDGSQA
jgi:hypothetical protein